MGNDGISKVPLHRVITKRDVALVVAALTCFGGVIRFAEKTIDTSTASAMDYTKVEVKNVRATIDVERGERQHELVMLNGKLDTITKILIEMRKGP